MNADALARIVQLGCLLFFTVGCGKSPAVPETRLEIRGAGSTFAAPILKKWGEQYGQQNRAVRITYEGVGSGKGEERFFKRECDIAGTDEGVSRNQLASTEAVQIPITAGIIVLAYNPEGLPDALKLPRAVYADIFLGKEIRWNDRRILATNPGKHLPNQPIYVVVRQDSSGTTFAFTNHLAAISEQWRQNYGNMPSSKSQNQGVKALNWPGTAMRAAGNSGVAGLVKNTPYSLSYVQYGAARDVKLGMAILENKQGNYVAPSGASGLETLEHAKLDSDLRGYFPDPEGAHSYPIVTFTWLLLRKEYESMQKSAEVKSFILWCLKEGQDYSEAAGNVRLASQLVQKSEEALKSLGGKQERDVQ